MVNWKILVKDYLRQILKVSLEGFAFLIAASVLGIIAYAIFFPRGEMLQAGPGGVMLITFSIAFKKNYCFLEEEKYGIFPEEESETTESTISDFTES